MSLASTIKRAEQLARPYRITKGQKFRLKDHDPGDTGSFRSGEKDAAKTALAEEVEALSELQDLLYADDRWSTLFIFQAMDAAGKDSAIKHVMSGVDPQGCQVASFKAPSSEELDHDYLWRCQKQLPERGRMGVFNRSYYEEVLIVRVHPEHLVAQRLPDRDRPDDLWDARFRQIRNFEKHLAANGTRVAKFFLHLSFEEQKRRFLERIDQRAKQWKFNAGDVAERKHWKAYMAAYEAMIRNTATAQAPWYVVPADHQWFTRLIVAAAAVATLASLHSAYPEVSPAKRKELSAAKKALLAE